MVSQEVREGVRCSRVRCHGEDRNRLPCKGIVFEDCIIRAGLVPQGDDVRATEACTPERASGRCEQSRSVVGGELKLMAFATSPELR